MFIQDWLLIVTVSLQKIIKRSHLLDFKVGSNVAQLSKGRLVFTLKTIKVILDNNQIEDCLSSFH